ncbi:MAG: AraC family transcriptional regulator [Firmicutes bacterium]|nr:AraC family transcriptional regulator [Bacillota bacterium]
MEEKLYTNPELNLDDLAKRLGVPRNTASQFINDCLKTNFYDYINRLRIEEIKRLLLDADKEYLTIIALATEAGFNSKTSFNRTFRQYTGMTPSEYKRHYCSGKQKTLSGNKGKNLKL